MSIPHRGQMPPALWKPAGHLPLRAPGFLVLVSGASSIVIETPICHKCFIYVNGFDPLEEQEVANR